MAAPQAVCGKEDVRGADDFKGWERVVDIVMMQGGLGAYRINL